MDKNKINLDYLNELDDLNKIKPVNDLDDNQLKYNLFIIYNRAEQSATKNDDINENNLSEIDVLYEKIIEYVQNLSLSYIWNNEKFHLSKPVKCKNESKTNLNEQEIYLCSGLVDYGDNLDDEWFIVYLLLKLTSEFSKYLVAQVQDFDGEFLLIQTANYLPDWASSAADNCMNNRVFLFNGELHIIPPAKTPAQITYLPASGAIDSPLSGAKIVFDFSKITSANKEIQECLMKRLDTFKPENMNSLYHKATCTIPAKLAWILKNNPGFISEAINRFCDKDPKDLKLCRSFNYFKPVDLVNYRVTFTKHLYGKLKYCDYKPEKRHDWPTVTALMSLFNSTTTSNSQINSTSLTSSVNQQISNTSSVTLFKERSSLGFKLTCAFEIISNSMLKDKDSSKSFEAYINKLKHLGYFKDYLENSKCYNELLDKAKESFLLKDQKSQNSDETTTNNLAQTNQNESNNSNETKHASNTNTNLTDLFESFYFEKLNNDDYVLTKFKEEIIDSQNKELDDNDDWLCVEAPQLDDYLEMYSRGEVSSAYDFRLISNAFKKFLSKPSVKKDLLEGAEYKPIDVSQEEKLIDFDVDSIESNLVELLGGSNKTKKNTNPLKDDLDNDEEDEDSETDSFYEIDDDLLKEKGNLDELTENFNKYMSSMDEELKSQKNLSRLGADKKDDVNEELNLDINLVTNALESYSSQLGLSGPVSNILKSIGL